MKKILGIDLGTTFSCVAIVDESGKPKVIPNSDNEMTTPSVVLFEEDGGGKVGAEAKELAMFNPSALASFIKRETSNSDYRFYANDQAYTVAEIFAYILKKLVQDANAHLGETIKDVVITCPAYFFLGERQTIKNAGKSAGLNVVSVLSEPTAAAFAYGMNLAQDVRGKNILVYDLGGGTFDVTVISVDSSGIKVLCLDGNFSLGGKDWDDAMLALITEKLEASEGFAGDIYEDEALLHDLRTAAEKMKVMLSSHQQATESIGYEGRNYRVTVTRGEFDNATYPLLMQTRDYTQCVMDKTQRLGEQIDEVILVGGSSYMPQVKPMLQELTGLEPKLYRPHEAVALGAAIVGFGNVIRSEAKEFVQDEFSFDPIVNNLNDLYSNQNADDEFSLDANRRNYHESLSREEQQAIEKVALDHGFSLDVVTSALRPISNVSSKSFGTIVVDGKNHSRKFAINLIYRDTPLPAEYTVNTYTICDNQAGVNFVVVENAAAYPGAKERESHSVELHDCKELWRDTLKISPNLPRSSPIINTFKLDNDGFLFIKALDPSSGNVITHEISVASSLTQKEIDEISERVRNTEVD